MERLIINKIEDIENVLSKFNYKFTNSGVSDGILGLSLFYFYYYKYTNSSYALSQLTYYIERSLETIGEHYIGDNFYRDIVDISSFLLFLKNEEFVDEEFTNYLFNFDQIIIKITENLIFHKNIDPITGVLLAGNYFLNRMSEFKYDRIIIQIIKLLEDLSIRENDSIYWNFYFRNKKSPTIELGLMHGISGIVSFLLGSFNKGILKNKCAEMINAAMRYLINKCDGQGVNLFPFTSLPNEKLEYQNLCYGDVGIGHLFYKVGKYLKNLQYEELGMKTLINSTNFKDEHFYYIKDASLLYGASGLSSIYKLIYDDTHQSVFLDAADYWAIRTSMLDNFNSPWAGYLSCYNQEDEDIQLSFSQGIIGIGIDYLSNNMNMSKKYLAFLNYPTTNL